jgi:UDP-N-acetylmuramoyl-L-alanyl-D-glutamate--2,6-diaminopimelate ligase
MDSSPPTSQKPGARLQTLALELGGPREGVSMRGDGDVRVQDVQQDSRRISPGDLFVARMGQQEGREARARMEKNVEQAIAHGAVAVMRAAGSGPALPLPTLEVPAARLRAAIGVAASAVHHHPSYVVEVLAVTGTNGKTTCTTLLADALDALAHRPACALVGTVAVRLGGESRPSTHTTPEGDEVARILAWARGRGASHAALEASSHALEQRRLAGTRVRVAGFTNLTQDHLDYHGSFEAYGAAKSLLFTEMHPGDAVINVDDPFGEALARGLVGRVHRVSTEGAKGADVRVLRATVDARGIVASLETPRGRCELKSAMLGAHNLSNLALALGMLVAMEIDPQRAADALGSSPGARGRLELASNPAAGEPVVLIDYAHTPDALARVLATLRPIARGRLLCVFGCGGDRDASKRAPMGRAVADGADLAFVTSDNPRTEDPRAIVDAILEGMAELPDTDDLANARRARVVEVDRARAIERAIVHAGPDDVVLVAGKGHEDYQIVGAEKRPFDDVAEARKALARRRAG